MKRPEANRIIYIDSDGQAHYQCGNCYDLLPFAGIAACPKCEAKLIGELTFEEGKDFYYYADDEAHVNKILTALEKNEGYCPCRIVRTEDTICPCKEYRTTGHCHCGLFASFEVKE